MVPNSEEPKSTNSLSKIGLYAPKPKCPILAHLKKIGYETGKPCPLSVLNKLDNMNYYGSDATLELLTEVQTRLNGTTHNNNNVRNNNNTPLTILDIGSGYGGTSRVLLSALPPTSTVTAVELQSTIHATALEMTRMAELNDDVPVGQIRHLHADALTDNIIMKTTSSSDDQQQQQRGCVLADAVFCRLCTLHIPRDDRTKLLGRMRREWLKRTRPGGVVAFEDYADGGLSEKEMKSLEENVAVPYGSLWSVDEWEERLVEAGFVDVVVEDVTERWAIFVRERLAEAEGRKEETDEMFGGSERRGFYTSVCDLFNPKEGKSGLIGVRVYATVPSK